MPNWCENELTITGQKKTLMLFKELAKSKTRALSLNNFVPYPNIYSIKKEINKHDGYNGYGFRDKGQFKDGYNWCTDNWGTKWDLSESTCFYNGDLLYQFSSAWSPPIEAINTISKIFTGLTFTLKFWEGGVGFKGIFKVKNGEILKRNISHYNGHRGG